MRARAALAIAAALFAVLAPAHVRAQPPSAAPAALAAPITVSANRVEYYGDAAIILARGDVRVTEPGGVVITGDAFAMNMGLRRFLVAGHVRLHTSSGDFVGAGYADFLVFRRQYFVPLDPQADRWTFFKYDFAHPAKGRQMPGDAFFIPDVSGIRPYIVARSATVNASTYVRFTPATFVLLDGALWTMPLPPYTYNFSANQNFAVNALSGASFDAPYNVAGSTNSLDAVHIRYDQQRADKVYASFEHHAVFHNGYAVFSLNPATQAAKQWNLLAYQRTSAASAINLDTQLFTYQYGLGRPLSSSGFADVQYLLAVRQSALRVDLTQQYSSLLAQPVLGYYGDPSHPFIPNHPFTAGVQWNGYDEHLLRTGLTYRLNSGYATHHDAYGITGTSTPDVSSYFVGGALYTPVYPGPSRTGLNASYTIEQTYLSFPNILQTQNFTATVSRRVTRSAILVGSVVIDTARARNPLSIISPNQATGVAPLPASGNGLPVILGPFLAATNRAYGLSAELAPSTNFQFTLAATDTNYSPVQIPFVAGPPRYQLSADVRARITRTLFIDVQRAYVFGWAGQHWSPQFNILVSGQ